MQHSRHSEKALTSVWCCLSPADPNEGVLWHRAERWPETVVVPVPPVLGFWRWRPEPGSDDEVWTRRVFRLTSVEILHPDGSPARVYVEE